MNVIRNSRVDDHSDGYKSRHAYQKVRNHAHHVMDKTNIEKICAVCGYKNTVDLCHLKAISAYDISTTISVVNDLSNLIYLCPNHHWEQENGLINPLKNIN